MAPDKGYELCKGCKEWEEGTWQHLSMLRERCQLEYQRESVLRSCWREGVSEGKGRGVTISFLGLPRSFIELLFLYFFSCLALNSYPCRKSANCLVILFVGIGICTWHVCMVFHTFPEISGEYLVTTSYDNSVKVSLPHYLFLFSCKLLQLAAPWKAKVWLAGWRNCFSYQLQQPGWNQSPALLMAPYRRNNTHT